MSGVRKIGRVIGGVEDGLSILAFVAMTAVVLIMVLCRYVFKISFMQGEEIARYLMIWCGYAGAAYGFRHHAHVGVVVFAEMLPTSWQPHVEKLRHILSTIVVIGLFTFTIMCLSRYLSTGQQTTATKLPTALVYSIIPISMALSVIHTITDVVCDFIPKRANAEEVAE